MLNLCIFCSFSNFAQKIFKGWGCNFTWSFGKVMRSKSMKMVFLERIIRLNTPVKLFWPHPLPRAPITFLVVAPVFLSLHFFLAPPWFITLIPSFCSVPPFFHFILQCRTLFFKHIFHLTPGLPGEDGGRTIWPAHNCLNLTVSHQFSPTKTMNDIIIIIPTLIYTTHKY